MIDSSARKPFVYEGPRISFADFEPFRRADRTETIGAERAESGLKRVGWLDGEVRRFPHEPPRVSGIPQRKCPTENRWASIFGGGVATRIKIIDINRLGVFLVDAERCGIQSLWVAVVSVKISQRH